MTPPPQPSFAEQRERLVLACQLDRLNLRLAARPTHAESLTLSILSKLAMIAPRLPGKLGKWSSGILQGTTLLRGVYESIFAS